MHRQYSNNLQGLWVLNLCLGAWLVYIFCSTSVSHIPVCFSYRNNIVKTQCVLFHSDPTQQELHQCYTLLTLFRWLRCLMHGLCGDNNAFCRRKKRGVSGELIRLNHGTMLQDRLCIISEVQHLEDPRLTMKNGISWIIMRGFWALCNGFGDYSQHIQIITNRCHA